MHPLVAKRQQWRGPAGRRPAQGVNARSRYRAGSQSMHREQKSPHAGAERQPPDREVLRAAHHKAAPEEAPQKASWGGNAPRLPSTAPASRR